MDSGNASWMLTAACLVFLMAPAAAMMYGGMVRAKAVLNMMTLAVGAVAVTAVVWSLWGWSIAFAGHDVAGVFGTPDVGFLLKDSIVFQDGVFAAVAGDGSNAANSIAVPFQMAVAIAAVTLISGALAERVRYAVWLVFVALWVTLCYAPLAHMVWGGGLLSSDGVLASALGVHPHDFAGGSLIHLAAGVAALTIVVIIGRREGFGRHAVRAHNMPLAMCGALLLWFGWLGLSAGSAGAANGVAVYTWTSSMIAAGAGALSWGILERLHTHRFTALGAVSGAVSGLVAISPGADVLSPLWTLVVGVVAGALCCVMCSHKHDMRVDDTLDVMGIHGFGAMWGLLAVGLFGEGTGLLAGGDWRQLVAQLCVVLGTVVYVAVCTAIVAYVLEQLVGWRVSDADEMLGVDFADQGERAYDLAGVASSIVRKVK